MTASNLSVGGLESCEGTQAWQITLGSGNTGWSPSTETCGFPVGTPTPAPTQLPTQPPSSPTPTNTPAPTPTPQPAPSGTLVTAIDAGGAASGNFVADTDFNQGNEFSDTSTSINTSKLAESIPQAVWQTCRWNASFTYTIPGLTAGTTYTVALDWAESDVARRQVSVSSMWRSMVVRSLTGLDVYATAGYKTALQKQFSTTANSSGQIVICLHAGWG